MKQQELARLFYRELLKICQHPEFETTLRIEKLYHLLNLVFVERSKEERLQFTTLFARIAYVGHKYNFSKLLLFHIHHFRMRVRRQSAEDPQETYLLGLKVVAESIAVAFDQEIPGEIVLLLPESKQLNLRPAEVKAFISKARVIAIEDDPEKQQLIIVDEDQDRKEIRMQYGIPERNENFSSTIDRLRDTFGFPTPLNLLDVEVDQEGIYRPKGIIIQPDYLVDISGIAECFKSFGTAPLLYLLKKFLPFTSTIPLMIGNIANFFLDELMNDPEITFKELFPKVFRLSPLSFALFEDSEVRKIMKSCQLHFVNLKRILALDLKESDIEPEYCLLEPSFYSEKYGLQGRLDVFYINPDSGKQSAIVELKSGKAYMPNKHGISQNHYTQTLLYDLLVKSVFKDRIAPANFILYSGVEQRQLRFAPVIKAQQMEALQIRNQLVAFERGLSNMKKAGLGERTILDLLRPESIPKAKGFVQRDLSLFGKVFGSLDDVERKYFIGFSSFIAQEQQLAKTGVQGLSTVKGLAALWLKSFEEKQNDFEIVSHLQIDKNESGAEPPIIEFKKTAETSDLANFRDGDMAILYPFRKADDNVLNNQIFKCTIVHISKTEVIVRLRYRQFNTELFDEENILWNLENDLLDSGFTGMYRGLFQFAQFPKYKKDLLLTREAPSQPATEAIKAPTELTEEQQHIFKKLLSAKDYFLLWGPPGTGKTSMMLKHIVAYLLNQTDENILLLAYTNRAVDEICEAIEQIDKFIRNEYLRIGSRFSTAMPFRDQLFDHKIAKVKNRKELREVIDGHRIFVGTVSSILGKQELLRLKKFNRVIIDEASQILEPMLVGLLPLFERFVLIGDHLQLPAVVMQDHETSDIEDTELKQLGLDNLRNSLFERLYKRCLEENWHWAFAQLSHQGRMHEEIMAFPNEQFYQQQLKVLPPPLGARQLRPLNYTLPTDADALEQLLSKQRFIFLASKTDELSRTKKTHLHEAQLILRIIHSFRRIYAASGMEFSASSIGVITPYRAQIAQIKTVLQANNVDDIELTIDTVERYQGGARDIILISLCANHYSQLESLVSLSSEGVDRKLNVAVTRARAQLVIVGTPEVLRYNTLYKKLIEQYQHAE